MQKREAQDSDRSTPASGALATPRVSGEQRRRELSTSEAPAPESGHSASEPSAVSEPSDTLLSAGKPAEKFEVLVEDRLASIDERLREIDGRLAVLEHKKTSATPEPRQKPWLWIAFLIALVVVFQLLNRVR